MSAARKTKRSTKRSPSRSRRKKVLFSAVTLLLFFAGLEGICRVVVRLTPNARWEDLVNTVDAVGFPALNQIYEPDAELFWRVKPNLEHVELSGSLGVFGNLRFTVSTDAQGHRRMPMVREAQHTVLFLGDSCIFGIGVDDHQAIPAVVQRGLDGVGCINAAIPGYSSHQGRRLLERLTYSAPPDHVVICFGFNDDAQWDHLSDVEHEAMMAAERSGLINRLRFVQVLRRVLPARRAELARADQPMRPRLTHEEYADAIRGIIQTCRRRGSRPVLLVWPYRIQMHRQGGFTKQEVLKQIAVKHGVKIVDLVDLFRARGGDALFIDVIHANARGCELAGEALIAVLQEELGIPATARADGGSL